MEHYTTLSADDYRVALRYLSDALAPRIRVEPAASDTGVATTVHLTIPRGATTVARLREWTDSEIANRVQRTRPRVIWILRNGTPQLRDELRDAGQSFVDTRGAVRVELPSLLIDRTDLDPVDFPARPEPVTDPFADRASLVVRAMLSTSVRRTWGIRELAQTAGVGLGTASRVVDQLHQLSLVDTAPQHGRPGAVRIIDPQRVLDRWTSSYDWTRNESLAVRVPMGDPEIFLEGRLPHLVPRDQRWALTLQAGASLISRHASWERLHVYVPARDVKELAVIAWANKWHPAEDGQLVLMRPYYRTSVWDALQPIGARRTAHLEVVSNLQLVLDLWNYPLRGREQAEVIRDRLLRPIWEA
jgi:hypothetical protein